MRIYGTKAESTPRPVRATVCAACGLPAVPQRVKNMISKYREPRRTCRRRLGSLDEQILGLPVMRYCDQCHARGRLLALALSPHLPTISSEAAARLAGCPSRL